MIAYRDGKQIVICDTCFSEMKIYVENNGPVHVHERCGSPRKQKFRCPDCVTTGEEVCVHG